MNKNNIWLGSLEKTYVRMSQELREKHEFQLGTYVSFRLEDGGVVALQVATAHKEDLERNPLHGHVTSEVYELIGVNSDESEQEIDLITDITLGCDPEFFLVRKDGGERQRAGRFFSRGGDVGYDHNGKVMEIRPLPSEDEKTVALNILDLLTKGRTIMNNVDPQLSNLTMMYGASYYQGTTAGFHVHFGLPSKILGPGYLPGAVAMQIVKALDFYLGIPCVIAEGAEDFKRRTMPNVAYGKPGGYILDDYTLEYRVPGGSLLRHPTLTRGLLGLGAVIIEDAVSRIRRATDDFNNLSLMSANSDIKELYPNLPNVQDIFFVMCNRDINIALDLMSVITEDIENMVSFSNRKSTVQAFLTSVLSQETFSNDIEYNWRRFYRHEGQQRQMDIRSASI